MDYETVTPEVFGAALRGIGLNILVRDVRRTVDFLRDVFGLDIHRVSEDFAIVTSGGAVLQLHADGTYGSHPLLGLVPENPPRGGGAEFRLYECDPDAAAAAAEARGTPVLKPPENRPHGLREVFILCEDGYAWVASRPLTPEERSARK